MMRRRWVSANFGLTSDDRRHPETHHRATGSRSPQRYMSRMRLGNAMTELGGSRSMRILVAGQLYAGVSSRSRHDHQRISTPSALAREGGAQGLLPWTGTTKAPQSIVDRQDIQGTHETWETKAFAVTSLNRTITSPSSVRLTNIAG